MACFNSCRNNCFGPYYPCPIWVCNLDCASNVVNPPINVPSWAFLTLTTTTEVASGGALPVTLITSSGTAITSTTSGVVNLTPGTYRANYNVTSVLGENGTNSFGLNLNGSTISDSISTVTGTAGDAVNTSNSVIFTVTANGVLNLVNLGEEAVDVNLANLTIFKIA